MMPLAKWKMIGYAAALFAAGAVSGGALGVYETKARLFQPQQEQDVALRMRARLQKRLELTPDQMAKLAPIIDSAAKDLHAIRTDNAQRVGKVFESAYSQISAILTPEQRVKLEQMQKEHRAMIQNRLGHWHQGGGPGGGGPDGPHGGGPGPHGPGAGDNP